MRRTALSWLLAGVGAMLIASAGVCTDATPSPSTAALLEALDRGAMERWLWKAAAQSTEGRRLAAEALASAVDPESVRQLRQLTDDPDPEVERTVMLAAGRIGRLADGSRPRVASGSATVREAAAWAACHTGGAATQPLLDLLQKETDAPVLATALANVWRLDTAWQSGRRGSSRAPCRGGGRSPTRWHARRAPQGSASAYAGR
jgi:hypothetical protein